MQGQYRLAHATGAGDRDQGAMAQQIDERGQRIVPTDQLGQATGQVADGARARRRSRRNVQALHRADESDSPCAAPCPAMGGVRLIAQRTPQLAHRRLDHAPR